MCAKLFALVLVLVLLYKEASAQCISCLSDMQCKGFPTVYQTYYCLDGCCETYNTLLAYSRITYPNNKCVGEYELATNGDANAYPWLAYVVADRSDNCLGCIGTLIAPGWVATDSTCYNYITQPSYSTNVYFYYDNVYLRQIYEVVDSLVGDGVTRIRYLKIQYIGSGTPQPITPLPVNCADLDPPQTDVLYWQKGTPVGTRTLIRKTLALRTRADCDEGIAENAAVLWKSKWVYCINGEADNDYIIGNRPWFAGSPMIINDASGNPVFYGMGVNGMAFTTSYPGNWTIFAKGSKSMDVMKDTLGVTCAA